MGPLLGGLRRRSTELRMALRTTAAALIAFVVARMLQLPQAYWAVLTSVIIIQASLGGSLKAGVDRLLGTFAGAIWGVVVTLAVPHRDSLALAGALALALAPLALVAALKPAYRVAPVTAVIVLLSTTGVQLGPVHYAIDRVLEIGLGCVIGIAVSLLVLPARAHGLLAEAAAETVRALRELSDLLLQDLAQPPDRTAQAAAHLRLRKALARVEGFADEARRERAHRLTDAPDPEPVARNLRRLHHDLTSVGRALAEPLPHAALQYLAEAAAELRRAISDYLWGAAAAFVARRKPPPLGAVDEALRAFRDSMDCLRRSGALRELSAEVVARVFGLAFALQQLRGNLGDLADRVAEQARFAPV